MTAQMASLINWTEEISIGYLLSCNLKKSNRVNNYLVDKCVMFEMLQPERGFLLASCFEHRFEIKCIFLYKKYNHVKLQFV